MRRARCAARVGRIAGDAGERSTRRVAGAKSDVASFAVAFIAFIDVTGFIHPADFICPAKSAPLESDPGFRTTRVMPAHSCRYYLRKSHSSQR